MKETIQPLYEQDFYLWLEDTATKLKTRDFDAIDIDNLIEEIEALGRSEKREFKNRLNVLLMHILKRVYVDSIYDNAGWERTIREQRRQIRELLNQSPSLEKYFIKVFSQVWQDALSDVKQDYPKNQFPDEWQFAIEIQCDFD
ncbi:DUF29 domain-containing protein [Gloeocapsopsis dulcis]|uniref:DUF29 domain-containing protein n=1 Tax=Gloeocapsopsis dulcis TaxID=2859516 RepID=UPI000CF6EA49|nr:DUF29 domain-containing protein [Gloeocapsopsis dulcis]WNN90496.1 DUF29 domain-containing protein [Gloeocapsopsis dulcis]